MSSDDTPIRHAIVAALGPRDTAKIADLAKTCVAAGINTLGDLAQATPQQVETLASGPLNGGAVSLGKLLLTHFNREVEHLQEKPPPENE